MNTDWRTFSLIGLLFVLPLYLASGQETEADAQQPKRLLYGVLDAGGRQFRFAIEVEHAAEADEPAAELLSIDEGGRRFPLDDFRLTTESLEFEIKVSSAKYTGEFDADEQAYVGTWQQRGAELPLALQKTEVIPQLKYAAVWSGDLRVLTQKLEVQFRELESGEVFFDSLTQKAGGFVVDKQTDGSEITYRIRGIPGGAEFTGTLSEDEQEISGTWKQGLFPIRLTLEKRAQALEPPVDVKQTAKPRPQTPKPPFPYATAPVKFDNEQAEITLAGTLTLPKGNGPFPAVVLISGSGPQDRDETIFEHKPFWVIADHFARNGIAALRFDDRGVGQSEGDFSKATSSDFATDVAAAIRFLRGQEQIDDSLVGLCGHSEGGIIAPIVAQADSSLGFIVLLAGPGVPGDRILSSQAKLILEASGADDETVHRQAQIQSQLLKLATQQPPLSTKEFIRQAKEELSPLVADGQLNQPSLDALIAGAAAQLTGPWFQYFLTYDPTDALRQVACPVLALIGEKDLQVDPELNLPALREALQEAPTKTFSVREIPGVNHLFQRCETGLVSEYSEIEETISPEVLQLISDWILEQTRK